MMIRIIEASNIDAFYFAAGRNVCYNLNESREVMKKKIFSIMFCGILLLGLTGCNEQQEKENDIVENDTGLSKEIYSCLENELGGYLVTEQDDLIEFPITEIKNLNIEKIEYFKGAYASNHKDNMYMIIYPKNGTYESEVMNKFNEYFSDKFSVYQTYESPSTPTIYIHSPKNNIDLKNIAKKCVNGNKTNDGKSFSSTILNKLGNTSKIVIELGKNKLGEITDETKVTEIISALSSGKQYGNACLSDGHAFDFKLYNSKNKLIETFYIWGDGNRLLPVSMDGCYYSISNGTDLRKIIEDETDYIFYNILDFRNSFDQKQQLIYSDTKYDYYLNSDNVDEIAIKFVLNNHIMTLKYALDNNYISAEKVANEYSSILIKKNK